MKCSECGREIGYHQPDRKGRPALIKCPRSRRVGEAVKDEWSR